MVTSSHKSCTPVLLPRHIALEDLDQNVGVDLRAKLDSVYHEKEITVAVAFKQSDSNVILRVKNMARMNLSFKLDCMHVSKPI